ncbi:hypothetical protein D3C72_1642080 [compost metagenome]
MSGKLSLWRIAKSKPSVANDTSRSETSSCTRTSGFSRRKPVIRGTSCWRANATGAVTRTEPRSGPAESQMPEKLCLICAKGWRSSSTSLSPASVSLTLRVVRCTNGTPASISISLIFWLMAALLTSSRSAARVKLPCSANTVSQCKWVHRVSIFGFFIVDCSFI